MDDFLGTSIQYSEKEILKLEKEYAIQKQKEVEEIIASGFLDTDYEDSSTEYSDDETSSDNNSSSISNDEIKSLSLTTENSNEYKKEVELDNGYSSSISNEYYSESPSRTTSSSSLELLNNDNNNNTEYKYKSNRNHLALLKSADISKMNKYLRYEILLLYVNKVNELRQDDKKRQHDQLQCDDDKKEEYQQDNQSIDKNMNIDENEEIEQEIYQNIKDPQQHNKYEPNKRQYDHDMEIEQEEQEQEQEECIIRNIQLICNELEEQRLQYENEKDEEDDQDEDIENQLISKLMSIILGDIKLFILGILFVISMIESEHRAGGQTRTHSQCGGGNQHHDENQIRSNIRWLFIDRSNMNTQKIYIHKKSDDENEQRQNDNNNENDVQSPFDINMEINIQKSDLFDTDNTADTSTPHYHHTDIDTDCQHGQHATNTPHHYRHFKISIPSPRQFIIGIGLNKMNLHRVIPNIVSNKYNHHKETTTAPVGSVFERGVFKLGLGAVFMGCALLAASTTSSGDDMF